MKSLSNISQEKYLFIYFEDKNQAGEFLFPANLIHLNFFINNFYVIVEFDRNTIFIIYFEDKKSGWRVSISCKFNSF